MDIDWCQAVSGGLWRLALGGAAVMRYTIIKATRRLRILFGGFKEIEEQHKLFQLPKPPSAERIAGRLMAYRYYYNTLSTTYRKQVYTARKLVDLDHQVHVRAYSDGWVSAHYELRPDSHPLEHLDGEELRSLNEQEKEELWNILEQI